MAQSDTDTNTDVEGGHDGHAGIDRTYRDSVDMRVAITSQFKRSALVSPPTLATAVSESNGHAPSNAQHMGKPAGARGGGFFRLPKRALRALIGPFYRAAKPFGRPVANKIKRSLLESWQQEVRQARSDMRYLVERNGEQLAEIRASQQALQQAQSHRLKDAREAKAVAQQFIASQQALQLQVRTLLEVLQDVRVDVAQLYPRLDRIEQYSEASARRMAVNISPDEVLIRTASGFVVCATTDEALLTCLLDTGDLERGTRLLIERLLEPGDVFIDVGANVGLHTLAAARAMQGKGHIVAFEPYEPTMRLLQKSISINGFSDLVEIHHAAVSDQTGQHSLFLGITSGHHSLYPLSLPVQVTSASVDVPVVTLDSVLPPDFHVNLIKIDVEGAELDVLAGATSLIKHNPEVALIAEFGPVHLARTRQSAMDWFSVFQRLGFDYQVIDAETGVLEHWSMEQLEQVESANLFFARPEAAVWEKVRTA